MLGGLSPLYQRRTHVHHFTQWVYSIASAVIRKVTAAGLRIAVPCNYTSLQFLSRRWEHLHARALQIRAELSTHIHRETGPQRPTHSFWSFLFEKTKLECGKKSHRLFASARHT